MDATELDGLSNSDRVLKIMELAEGPMTIPGIYERPGIASVMSLDQLRSLMENLRLEGRISRQDLEGHRSTYSLMQGEGPTTGHAPAARGVNGHELDARVLQLLAGGAMKREILMAHTKATANGMTITLDRLKRGGKIVSCHPYGSYMLKPAPVPESAPPPAAAASNPAQPVVLPPPQVTVKASVEQRACFDATIAELEVRAQQLEREAQRIRDTAKRLAEIRDAA